MNLDQLRLDFLKAEHQFLLLDAHFNIVKSCHSLVDISTSYQHSIFDLIPFLMSFQNEIEDLQDGQQLRYDCINMSLSDRQSVYDFTFQKIQGNTLLIIIDGHKKYEHLEQLQHERNTSVISKEIKEKEAKMKSRFLANMSHEIRTPMNIVMGYSNLLLSSKDLNKENRDFAKNISIAAKDLLVLINDVLDLSKMEAGYLNIEIITFNLKSLLNNLQTGFHKQCQDRAINIEISVEENVPDIIQSDPVRINQILTNLFSNALKFSHQGGTIRVHIGLRNEAKFLQLNVIDAGIGIDADKQEKIFESFTQEEESTTRKYGGTGLGLSIVKKLTDLLDGTISLTSKKGKGSTFSVQIPYVKGFKEDLEEEQEVKGFEAKLLIDKQILVAEDNRMNRMLITKILEDADCNLTLANNGQEAVDYANTQLFDAILMDIQMPVLDGLEATIQIKKNSVFNTKTPIIAMTAHSFEEDIKRCFDAGMSGYVSKPFTLDSLFSVLGNQLQSEEGSNKSETNGLDPSSETTHDEITLDFQFLEQLSRGNKAFIKEFFEIFVEEVSDLLAELTKEINDEQTLEVKKAVHQIKPILEMIGLFETKKQIEQFEQGEISIEKTKHFVQLIQPPIESALNVIRGKLKREEIST